LPPARLFRAVAGGRDCGRLGNGPPVFIQASGEAMPLIASLIEGLRPPPDLTVSEWADQNVILTSDMASEPGAFRTSRTPYAREMMDVIREPGAELIVYHTSTQIAKTTTMLNGMGYHIEHDPCPMMMILPDKNVSETFSKGKLAPFLNGTPVLAAKVGMQGSRANTSTMFRKEFAGGFLNLAAANVPNDLRMQSIRLIFCDEIDAFPASSRREGDPIGIALKRAQNFADRKLIVSSTPLIKGVSKIDELFEQTDQRHYHVPLPCCGELQELVWANVKWSPGKPDTAEYCCKHCGELHGEAIVKQAVLDPRAKWVAHKPENVGKIGFHIWQIYSPWSSMATCIIAFEDAKGNPLKEKLFFNTYLGESYDEGERIKTTPEAVYAARVRFPEGVIPKGACAVTAGVDVQGNRLEVLFVAHGPNKQSWFLKHQVINGDPSGGGVWAQLAQALSRRWPQETHPHITRPVEGVAIDSGYLTQQVYDFAAKAHLAGRPWYAIKGMEGEGKIAWDTSPIKFKSGARLHLVGIDSLKTEVHAHLSNEEQGENAIYIRNDDCFSLQWIEQLFAEQVRVILNTRSVPKREWHRLHPRNEALDLAVYAEAVHRHLNIDHVGRLASMDTTSAPDFGALAELFN
jgi:phage terminase large subunit GpA-like protein